MQVQLRQQRTNLLGPAPEEWEDPALEPLLQAAHSWTLDRHRAARQRQPARLAVAVTVHWLRPGLPLFRLPAAQQLIDFLLEQPLDERLHVHACEGLEIFPHRRWRAGRLLRYLGHGGGSFRTGTRPVGDRSPERCHRLPPISTPSEATSEERKV